MRIFKNIISIILIACFSLFALTGCTQTRIRVVNVEMCEDAPTEIRIGEFDYSKYQILVTLNTGEERALDLTEEMLPFDEYQKTYKAGLQTLVITYKDYSFEFSINVTKYEFENITIDCPTITYDGQFHSVVVEGNYPVGTTISYPNGSQFKNVGTYNVSAILSYDAYATLEVKGVIEIVPADYDVSKFKFEDRTFTYDGTEKELTMQGVPKDLNVTYTIDGVETNKKTDAGVYKVTASINPGKNFNKIEDYVAYLTIEKGTYDMEKFSFNDKTVTYTGDTVEMCINNKDMLPAGVKVTYEGLDVVDAGTYVVTAHFTGDEDNYNPIPDMTAKLTIKKAKVSLTGINFDSQSFVYDKLPHSIQYVGTLPTGITFAGYTNNNQTDVGTYTVYANFIYRDSKNYEQIAPLSATLEITKADLTGIKFENKSYTYDGLGHSLTATNFPAGVTPVYSITSAVEPGDYEITASFVYDEKIEKNYNPVQPMKAVLTIERKNLKSGFQDVEVDYDGNPHNIQAILSEDEEEWITVEYFIYNSIGQEVQFTPQTDPGKYLVFARYKIDESHKDDYDKHYNGITRESAYLTINKMTYTPVFTERKLEYTGSEQSVTVDMTEVALHPHLDFKVKYEDNTRTVPGIQVGVARFTLTTDAAKYYNEIEPTYFYFAIKNGEQITYIPEFGGTQATYDGNEHNIEVTNLPQGINVEFKNNGKIIPNDTGYPVTATFTFEDDVISYYYKLPNVGQSGFNLDVNGNKYKIVRLYIAKQLYELTYDVNNFVYDGKDKVVKPLGCPVWIDVVYEYKEEERKECGATYHVICTPSINDEEKAALYKVETTEVEFTIKKADVSYSYADTTVKFDGKIHKITVLGLPEGITAVTSGDEVTAVGTYPVIVHFVSEDDPTVTTFKNYNSIGDQLVYLTIENNIIYCSDFFTFIDAPGSKLINQFSSLKDFLGTRLDLNAFDIEWKIDYYTDLETIMGGGTEHHSQGTEADDFIFSEYTENDEFVLVNCKLILKNGYVTGDESIDGSCDIMFSLSVSKTTRVELNGKEEEGTYVKGFVDKIYDNMTVTQGSSLRLMVQDALPESNVIKWTYECKYMNNGVQYLTERNDSHVEYDGEYQSDFYFSYATWGNRYVELELTIKCNDGYCLYDGERSYLTYVKTIRVNVSPRDTVDISYFEETLSSTVVVPQYSKFSEFVVDLIDQKSATVTWKLYDRFSNVLIATNETDYILKDCNKTFFCEIKTVVDDKYIFSDKNHMFEYETTFDVTVEYVEAIDFEEIYESFVGMQEAFKQYDYVYRDYLSKITLPSDVGYTLTITDLNGVDHIIIPGETDYELSLPTGDVNYKCLLSFYPTGDKVVYDMDGYNSGKREVLSYLEVLPREIIDTRALKSKVEFFNEISVNRYTSFRDLLGPTLDAFYSKYNFVEFLIEISTYTRLYYNSDLFMEGSSLLPSKDIDYIFSVYKDKIVISITLYIEDDSSYIFSTENHCFAYYALTIYMKDVTAFTSPALENLTSPDTVIGVKKGDTFNQFLDEQGIPNIKAYLLSAFIIDRNTKERIVSIASGSFVGSFKFDIATTNTSELIRVEVELIFEDGYTILDSNSKYQNSISCIMIFDVDNIVKLAVNEYTSCDTNLNIQIIQFVSVDTIIKQYWSDNNRSIMGENLSIDGTPIIDYSSIIIPTNWKYGTVKNDIITYSENYLYGGNNISFYERYNDKNIHLILLVTFRITGDKYKMDVENSTYPSTYFDEYSFTLWFEVTYIQENLLDMSTHISFWGDSNKSLVPGQKYSTYEYYGVSDYLSSGKMKSYINYQSDKKYTYSSRNYVVYINGDTTVTENTTCYMKYYFVAESGNYFSVDSTGKPVRTVNYNWQKEIKPVSLTGCEKDLVLTGNTRRVESGTQVLNFPTNNAFEYVYHAESALVYDDIYSISELKQEDFILYSGSYYLFGGYMYYEVYVDVTTRGYCYIIPSSSSVIAYKSYRFSVSLVSVYPSSSGPFI